MMINNSSSKNHSKRSSSSRDRERNRSAASESGGSSQCDTPPLTEKDGPNSSQGRYAGISVESIQCMAEQVGAEINADAATNLAEDVSYKLRQMISSLALHSVMMKKSRVDTWDVNVCLQQTDTSPVVGSSAAPYACIGEEKLCSQYETVLNVTDYAMTSQTFNFATTPSLVVEWITDERSLSNGSAISLQMQNYYTKIARAILNLKKIPKKLAVKDLMTNTKVGPIFPNLFNLAVLVLNDDNLKVLNVPAKNPLQANVLKMVDALCSNPCSRDTNIQQQFQRLFPEMVSNILGEGALAERMVLVLAKVVRTWPTFSAMGQEVLADYLAQGSLERITAPMVRCLLALGRRPFVACLAQRLDHLDRLVNEPRRGKAPGVREAMLDASTCLLRPEQNTPLEDYVMTDYTMYEILGDSIMPRRKLMPVAAKPSVKSSASSSGMGSEELAYTPARFSSRCSRARLLPRPRVPESSIHREAVFEPAAFRPESILCRIQIKIHGRRSLPARPSRVALALTQRLSYSGMSHGGGGVVVAGGLLNRFRYRLAARTQPLPIFAAYTL